MSLDLPLIWAILIATAVLLYVALDGFDLGVGILFPAATPKERDLMTASIAPVWDGNETWLVLGGGGLLAAFPLAYAIVMPAMYLPIGFMLVALIFRGVAFEFRAKAGPSGRGRKFWTAAFAGGSLVAALAQGLVLGGFLQGIAVEGRAFAGGHFDWLTPFSLIVAVSLAAGYALLGACWLIYKTEDALQAKARRWASQLVIGVGAAMAAVSLATLSLDPLVTERWGASMTHIEPGKFIRLAPLPLLAAAAAILLWRWAQNEKYELRPFLAGLVIFACGFVGLGVSLFPYAVPFEVTIWQAAAADNALALMLAGVVVLLPVILGYTAYVYWIFRGKASPETAYH
ncbi:cytochrome d ubiquinol oxidase subunit II [Amphiplicatus metriothermophilus]|uniref:Cytochrome bd-I ubiquinol oxidase subunit 2 apoprotein n=1 Tax=Amphiplicatus metriothermophilus TaxID=1519374 RepID=A0A239PYG5_9PROT|nr:cytochrome d ubiquinol oxidase subunit II [Amphiplicatus metriothermophilus]MBB5518189.1 cytochrome d ubiquinol oxidase subunit II [Amphiplicatus metriothermophilus]SNT75351.1 cytochrome bd-I ubiquinol oxidase subunit 2 apoprotein [Amphiplicatus metriothermophilus]